MLAATLAFGNALWKNKKLYKILRGCLTAKQMKQEITKWYGEHYVITENFQKGLALISDTALYNYIKS